MEKGLIRKGLVLSVIVLFISVGVQPVFAGESITSTLDKEEDCIECQVSDGFSLLRAKILLFKVKVVTNFILSSRLGKIPEIKEDCQEILDVINSDKPLGGGLICNYVLFPIVVIAQYMTIWAPPANFIGLMILAILDPIGYLLDCDWYPT